MEDGPEMPQRDEPPRVRLEYFAANPPGADASGWRMVRGVVVGVVGILAKSGMKNIDPVLATAVRSVVMMVVCILVALATGMGQKIRTLHTTAMWMIVLSGIAGAASWVFGFLAYDKIGVAKTSP